MLIDLLSVALASFCSITVLFLITKLIGHKQISQLDLFDYINGISIGSIAAELATEIEEPLKPLIAMIVFGAVTLALNVVTGKSLRIRKYINGTPTIIMNDGKIYRKNMKKAKLELSEFMLLCRQAGYFDMGQIQTAIFEYNGRMTFLPVAQYRPATPADMNLSPEKETIFAEVIMDGRILGDNLHRMGKNEKWLEKKLKEQGYKSAKEVFLGLTDDKGNVSFYANEVD